jgi:hypothetical protein
VLPPGNGMMLQSSSCTCCHPTTPGQERYQTFFCWTSNLAKFYQSLKATLLLVICEERWSETTLVETTWQQQLL